MAGMFDDLIPAQPTQGGGMFDDLMPQQKPKKSGAFLNATAGINESLAGTLGAPVDMAANILNAGISGVNALTDAGIPSIQNQFLGSNWWKDRMGDIGADPRDVVAASTPQKVLRGAARGATDAASVFLPASVIANASGAGSMTGNVARELAAQPGTQAIAGAVGGAVGESQDSPVLGAATAMAVPLFGRGIGMIARPPTDNLSAEQKRLAELAVREGINLTPAQMTGSRPLQTMESVLSTLPMTSGAQRSIIDKQASDFTRAVLRQAGISADDASPEVIAKAAADFGRRYSDITSRIAVRVDDDLVRDLAKIEKTYVPKLGPQSAVLKSYMDDIISAGEAIPGDIYQAARSNLRTQAKGIQNSDGFTAKALRDVRSALDRAADRSIPAELRDEWSELNRLYKNFKPIEKAMESTTNAATAGMIPPTALAQQVRAQGGYAQGRGDLNDLSRVGTGFLRDPIPNSGTPERAMMANLLTGATGLGGAALIDPITGAAAVGVPKAVQGLYNTDLARSYFTQRGPQIGPDPNRSLLAALLLQGANNGP